MRRLRIALCQTNPTVGDLDGNVKKIIDVVADAEESGADVAVFPELSITGYPPEDLVLKPAFVQDNLNALAAVAARAQECAIVVGFVDQDRDLYNAAALCYQGEVKLRYRKRLLPNYSVFDEKRYFSAGNDPLSLVELHGVKIGLTVCEDVWSPDGAIAPLTDGGAEVILNLNGSPYRRNKQVDREVMLSTRAADNSTWLVYVNQVGGQDELVFDGGSVVVDPEGHVKARAVNFDEQLLITDIDVSPVYRKRRLDPRGHAEPYEPLPIDVLTSDRQISEPAEVAALATPLGELEEVWRALTLGTRDYVAKNGFTSAGVALSGGVDSSIVVALAVDALGAENVHAVLMPSRFSSDHSVSDAVGLCENLGVSYRQLPIEPAHDAFLRMLKPSFDGLDEDVTEENLQSRIRGVSMMALSNKLGWLILTTGNKSEMAVGYSTLYGDTAGGYAVIKDVPKTLVYELCRWRNEQTQAPWIPEDILTKPPSAELRPDQRDDQSLPPYDILDPILQGYVEDDLTAGELVAAGHDPDVVERIVRLVDRAEYKRRQSPPGIRITAKAFGRDRRVPITNRYRS